MKTVKTKAELRSLLSRDRAGGKRIGLVPTMGAFHEGHLSLMRTARDSCDTVVVSLFVNPTQFNSEQDLLTYPEQRGHDAELAEQTGVDYLFVPSRDEIYPAGFATKVVVSGVTGKLEGEYRGTKHFEGVATVVVKLLNIVAPDLAFFGQKDAQQVLVIKRVVADLDIPTQVVVCPTIRETDGLAMSSRNVHLDSSERSRAAGINLALEAARAALGDGADNVAQLIEAVQRKLHEYGIEPEYVELVRTDTLEPVDLLQEGEALLAVAAYVGRTRLIDNVILRASGGAEPIARPAVSANTEGSS